MQTWKLKSRPAASSTKTKRRWKTRLFGIVLILATLGGAVYDFPSAWNQGARFVKAKTSISLPALDEKAFRLGLDLQGGTHLVYDADMKNIPEKERAIALEGVRDVIERRVNAFGVSEPVVQTTTTGGAYRVIVELAGVLNVADAIKQIGETPVLEFKEPGSELNREPTADEKKQLEEKQKADRAAAAEVLRQARNGSDFKALVEGKSIDPNAKATEGKLDNLIAGTPLVKAALDAWTRVNGIVSKVVEDENGLNIIKYLGAANSEEMQLSHILVCYEGKTGCGSGMTQLDASTLANRLKNETTLQSFADTAKQYSADKGSAEKGGDLGWISPGQTVAPFEQAAKKTAIGAISDVVESDFGYHLIYKRASRPVKVYSIQRIVMKLSSIFDVVPPASPWKNTELSGKHLKRSAAQFDPQSGSPYVSLVFSDEGGKLFGDLTSRLVGQKIAIFLDGSVISAPTVQDAIYGGQAQITGDFTLEEVKLLVQRLNAGALPVPVKLMSQQTVGPILGAISLQQSIKAALVGFVLVALFMILVYRLPGILAVIALLLYAVLNLAAYRVFGVTVTLSSIAGFVLSLGIAVDANVLIFERFKDEFRAGRDLSSAIEEGFKRAWPPIRDGHLTTLISALVLYTFSSSVVRGFALTLGIGVLLSLFTAITVTRSYIINTSMSRWLQKSWMYGRFVKKA